jgi:glucose-1-phosphate thymidylyltransferase
MKVVIPVAGAGTTLRPHTHTQPKPLIPVAGKPILGHIIDKLMAGGLTEFIFVIGYLGEKIKRYVEEHYTGQITYTFVEQEPRLGIGHAVWLCREAVGNDPMLVVLGDTIVDAPIAELITSETNVIGVQKVSTPQLFGIALIGPEGIVRELEEKPQMPRSNHALTGLYFIRQTAELMTILREKLLRRHENSGEINLTDSLMDLIRNGHPLRALEVNSWFDCGRKDSLLEINRMFLQRQPQPSPPNFPGTVILPPVYISPGCEIRNSIIGPNVAIGEHSIISDSIVQNSILGAYTRLENIVIKKSIIGNDTSLVGRVFSVNIGDNTEIDFSN